MQITPSIISLFATGTIILFIITILLPNYNKFLQQNYITKIKLLTLLCIAIGIHGLIHLGVEVVYNYNPLKILYKN